MATSKITVISPAKFVFCTVMGAALVLSGCGRPANTPQETRAQGDSVNVASQPQPRPAAVKTLDGDAQPEIDDKAAHHDSASPEHDEHDKGKNSEGHTTNHSHFRAEGALVSNHGIPLFLETQSSGGFTPQRRAELVTDRLNDMAQSHGLEAEHISMRSVNGVPTVFFFHPHRKGEPGHVLATIDPKTAAQFGFGNQPDRLAFWWRDVLRDHTLIVSGEPPLYTTPYSGSLQRFYELCQREHKGVPTHESFEQALANMKVSERDALHTLYIRVPSNYQPISGDGNQAHKAEEKVEGEKHHEKRQHHD